MAEFTGALVDGGIISGFSGAAISLSGGLVSLGCPSPLVSSLSPANLGTLTRFQKITFTLTGAGNAPLIEVKYANDEQRYVVYDQNGFSALFADHSTVTGSNFSLLPRGGWPASITALTVGDFAEAAA